MSIELNVININEDVQGCGPECDHFYDCDKTLAGHLQNFGIEVPQKQEPEPNEPDPEDDIKQETTSPEQDQETAKNISSQKVALLETHSFSRECATLKFFKNTRGEIDLKAGEAEGLLESFKDSEATTPGSISRDEYKGYIEQLYSQRYVQIPCPNEKGDLIFVTELSLDPEGNVTQTEYRLNEQELHDGTEIEDQTIDQYYEIATVDKPLGEEKIEPLPITETLTTPAAQKIFAETGIALEVQTVTTPKTERARSEEPSLFQQGLKIIRTESKQPSSKEKQALPKTERKQRVLEAQVQQSKSDQESLPALTIEPRGNADASGRPLEKNDAQTEAELPAQTTKPEYKVAITIAETVFVLEAQPEQINQKEQTEALPDTDHTLPVIAKKTQRIEVRKQVQQSSKPAVRKIRETVPTGITVSTSPDVLTPKSEVQVVEEAEQNTSYATEASIPKKAEKLNTAASNETDKIIKASPDQPTPEAPNIQITETGETTVHLQTPRIAQKEVRSEPILVQMEPQGPVIAKTENVLKTPPQENIVAAESTEKTQPIELQGSIDTSEKSATETELTSQRKEQPQTAKREKTLTSTSIEKQSVRLALLKEKERRTQETQAAFSEIRRIQELRRAYEQLTGNNALRYSPPQNDTANLPATLIKELEQIAA